MTLDRERLRDIVARTVRARLGSAGGAGRPGPAPSRGESSGRGRALVTEDDVMRAHHGGRGIVIPAGALVTPLARDALERYGLEVRESLHGDDAPARVRAAADSECRDHRVAIAADHGGYRTKQMLIAFLRDEAGIECDDLGTHSEESVDYPDFAAAVANAVASGTSCRGIVVDGAGIGSAITANKVRGVRAAHCSNVVEARNAREHNDANVLSLGGRMIGDQLAKAITIVFLRTDFEGGRHQKRIDKINELES